MCCVSVSCSGGPGALIPSPQGVAGVGLWCALVCHDGILLLVTFLESICVCPSFCAHTRRGALALQPHGPQHWAVVTFLVSACQSPQLKSPFILEQVTGCLEGRGGERALEDRSPGF